MITILSVFSPFHIGQLDIVAQSLNHAGKGFIDDRFLLSDHPVDVGRRGSNCLRQLGLRCPGFDTHDFYINFHVVFDHDPVLLCPSDQNYTQEIIFCIILQLEFPTLLKYCLQKLLNETRLNQNKKQARNPACNKIAGLLYYALAISLYFPDSQPTWLPTFTAYQSLKALATYSSIL